MIVPFLGKGRPACHSERSAAPRSQLHAVVCPTAAYAVRHWGKLEEEIVLQHPSKGSNTILGVSHLVICDASILLQHLQHLLMFPIILTNLLSVELQQFPWRTQVRQPLVDGGEWGVSFSTRGTKTGSVRWKKYTEEDFYHLHMLRTHSRTKILKSMVI